MWVLLCDICATPVRPDFRFRLPEFLGVDMLALTPNVFLFCSFRLEFPVVTVLQLFVFFRCAVWVEWTPLRVSLKKDGSFILWAVWDVGVTVM